jgi:hypothetical protein
MKVEELEVDRLYQSVRSDITNLYVYHEGHRRKLCESQYKHWAESEEDGKWEVSQFIN